LSLRPDVSTLEDYEKIPIEAFGAALLRGMGWKEGEAVGKNKNGLLEPILQKPRPHLLGLGAAPAPPIPSKDNKKIEKKSTIEDPFKIPKPPSRFEQKEKSSEKSSEKIKTNENDSTTKFKKGDFVTIQQGRHKGQTGNIVEIKQKSNGTAAKIQLHSNEIARVWVEDIIKSEETKSVTAPRGWIRPRLYVKIISKSLQKGKYYNQKCIIQDVVSKEECIVRMSTGEIVERNLFFLKKYLFAV
jgi:G patch domain/KOW motif-containing protein